MSIFRSSDDKPPEPVKVAYAANQAEAELIQGILREKGIPSITKKPNGTFLTDLFGIGPRQILVPASAAEESEKLLASVHQEPEETGKLSGT
jgi:hypothetical protein